MRKELTKKEYEQLTHLRTFERWFGLPRIERDVVYEGAYIVYYPGDDGEESMVWCRNIDYLDGWLYGVVEAITRSEFREGFERNGHSDQEVESLR